MLIDWFQARDAVEVGKSLAGCVLTTSSSTGSAVRPGTARTDLQRILERATREVVPLKLNVFKRAKLLGSFKWTLLDHGVDKTTSNELTQLLLLQISGLRQDLAARASGAAVKKAAGRSSMSRLPLLIAEAQSRSANGHYSEAIERLREALAIDDRNADAHANLGAVYVHVARYGDAEREIRRAVELKPTCVDAQLHLGTLLHMKGDFAAAETALRRAVKGDPSNPEGLVGLGMTLAMRGQLSEAKKCFAKAQRLKPGNTRVLCALGWMASIEGRFEDAETLFRSALEIDPKQVAARSSLVRLRRMTTADKDWLEGVERTLASRVPPHEESRLRFAMGKYFDDLGNFSGAFEQYKRANALYRQMVAPYDRNARSALVDDMMRLYTRQQLGESTAGASDSAKPVLVTGMPRSGTSLVEQIIASHPSALGAGELDFWQEAACRHKELVRSALPDSALKRKLADSYLRVLSGHAPDAARIVDKSTFNSDYLGLFHAVFPHARIIYLRRDPIDVCLSCYFQDFANAAPYAFDLGDLAHYYREHHRLMEHWRSALPEGTLLDVPYAELVADPETWSRKIIEFIGLPWDPGCLEFHRTPRAVVTASHWQVRQKIYASSVGRWKNYRKFIRPLLELQDLAP